MAEPTTKSAESVTKSPAGLADVVAADSSVCFIDGQKGRLVYRGYDVADLAEHSSFRETAYLLWYGNLPTRAQLAPFQELFVGSLRLPIETIMVLKLLPLRATPMEVLRTGVSSLGNFDPDSGKTDPEAIQRKCTRLISRMMMLICAHDCVRNGRDPIPPKQGKSMAYNFLYMRAGDEPTPEQERAMEVQLILHADHEFNASTFTARVIASTMSDVYSSVVGAIGALKGPLHGGANQDVVQMLDQIDGPEKAEAAIKDMLSKKIKVPGFGHRVYKTMDPRATILRKYCEQLTADQPHIRKTFETALKVEEVVLANTKVYPNVDFFSGIVYRALGIPDDLFTPIFALSRAVGWTAHIQEQWSNNRIIRPRADYVGPLDLTYVPIDQRK